MNKKSIFLLTCFSLLVLITGCGGNSKPPAEPILSDSAINLIPNGDFEADSLEGWDFYRDREKTSSPTIVRASEGSNHYLYFTAENCGEEDWHQQIIPCVSGPNGPSWLEFELKSGKEYFISLKAKSDTAGGRIHATLNKYDDLSIYVGGLIVNTTTELKTYTKFIKVGNGEKVRLALSLGNYNNIKTNNGKQFYIDDVQLLEQ